MNYALAIILAVIQVVDFNFDPPKFKLFQNSTTVLEIQLKNNTNVVDGTGYTPYLYIASTATSRSPVVATCAFTTISNSTFTATLTSNNLVTAGTWIYGCGLSNATGVTTFRQGLIEIVPDPWR